MITIKYPSNAKKTLTEELCAIQHSKTCVNGNLLFRAHALAYLEHHRDPSTWPFLLVWAPTTPHAAAYNLKTIQTSPVANLGWRKGQFPPYECKRGHAAQIEQHIDLDINALLNFLQDNPELNNNTLLVFTSDNGPHADCKDDLTYTPLFFEGNGGLRGWKTMIWDGGLRVPTLVRWPGMVEPNSVSQAVQTLYDLEATFLEAAGITQPPMPNPPAAGGVSQLAVWLNGDANSPVRDYIHLELCNIPYQESSCLTGTIDTKTAGHWWKLVVAPFTLTGQLYDVS
jgi:arylsulfatase A-like enzyme